MTYKREFYKVLNPLDVLVTAFGAMIGWGWVVSTGGWLTKAGVFGTVLGFVIGGIMIFFVGLTYSELTTAMPQAGGVRVFSFKAFGPAGSFVCSWFMLLSYIGVVCFEACSLPTVIQYIFPKFLRLYLYSVAGFDIYATWLAVALLLAFLITYVNVKGIKAAAVLQTILTIIIALVGIILVAASAINGDVNNLSEQILLGEGTVSTLKNILSVAVIAPFFLFGFDVIPQVAEEINVPLKRVGKLMLLSIVLAVAFYGLVVFAVGYVMSPKDIASSLDSSGLVTADAMAKAFSSEAMAKILIIGGVCGIVTSWNSFLMGGSRGLFSMAEAHMIPAFFGSLDEKHKTPKNAIVLIGFLSAISVFFGRSMLVWIADVASFACCIAYCLVAIAFIILRKKDPELHRPYKVKNYLFVGLIATIMSGLMAALYLIPGSGCTFTRQEAIIALAWSLIGIIFAVMSKVKYGKDFGITND
jgi:amino acid transporter